MTAAATAVAATMAGYGFARFRFCGSGIVFALVLYIALQRYYIRGLTSGVVKG